MVAQDPAKLRTPRTIAVVIFGALVVAIVVFAVTLLNVDSAGDAARTTQAERAGLGRVSLLWRALVAAVDYRRSLSEGAPGPQRDAARSSVDTAIDALGAAERRQPLLGSDWTRIQTAWQASRTLSPQQFGDGAALFRPLLHGFVSASDATGLATDSESGTVNVADALINRLPPAIERMSALQAQLARNVRAPTNTQRLDLWTTAAIADSVLRSAYDDLRALAGTTGMAAQSVPALLLPAEGEERSLISKVEGALARTRSDRSSKALAQLAATTIARHQALYGALVPVLDRRLANRLNESSRRQIVAALTGALILAALAAVVLLVVRVLRARAELAHVRREAAQVAAELARARAEARYFAVFHNALIGLVLADGDGRLRDFNAAFESMLGRSREMLGRATLFDLLREDERETTRRRFRQLIDGELDATSLEQCYVRGDGRTTWAHASLAALRDKGDAQPLVIALLQDVTERKHFNDQLVHAATHDALTGLPNRKLFLERLESRLRDGKGAALGVLFADVDNFKFINDNFGHVVGDEVLRIVGSRLAASSPDCTVARLGGDEFAIILNGEQAGEALHSYVDRLLSLLRQPLVAEGRTIRATASIGVAVAGGAGETPDDLLREADAAMYAAKAAGRAQAEFFDRRLHVGIARRMELVSELEGALHRGEFRLLYQPIARLTTGFIVGYEALLRWEHPRLGLLKPAHFLEEAKMAGAIGPIGRFVIAEAIREIRTLRERRGDLRVHVNLSADQILEPDLDAFIAAAVRAGGVPASALVLEIVEASIVESASASHRMLERLKRLGMDLFVDDFGVGYSSLRYLRDVPVAGIKIDASFVRGLDGETTSRPIVRMLVELCASLGLALIAEGVETPQLREALVRTGCTHGQGNLLGRPEARPAEAVLVNW